MSRVCAVHNEYCPDGDCRWCVAPAAEPDTAVPVMDFRYGFAMHQPAAEPELCPVTMTEAMHAPLVYHALPLVVTGLDFDWPPGGVTGDGG